MAARYDRLRSDDLRLLWGAANFRGADNVASDVKADLWNEINDLHDAWTKAAAEGDQDPWATVDHRSKETMEEEEHLIRQGLVVDV